MIKTIMIIIKIAIIMMVMMTLMMMMMMMMVIIIIKIIIIISLFQPGDFFAGSTTENIPWWLLLPCTRNHLQHI